MRETLRRTDLVAGALTLELTETVMLDAGHAAVRVLRELRQQGVKIALDDFGTGHASLHHLGSACEDDQWVWLPSAPEQWASIAHA